MSIAMASIVSGSPVASIAASVGAVATAVGGVVGVVGVVKVGWIAGAVVGVASVIVGRISVERTLFASQGCCKEKHN